MSTHIYKYCPKCGSALEEKTLDERLRMVCVNEAINCDFIHWDNPTPVVAAIVEHEGSIILARNAAWPPEWYAVITGFLEKGESPEEGILRELKEELNLEGEIVDFVGAYDFQHMNQIIMVYHIKAWGEVQLSPELVDYRRYQPHEIKPWPMGTGRAVKHWQERQGIFNDYVKLGR